jgi:hypothetical protein
VAVLQGGRVWQPQFPGKVLSKQLMTARETSIPVVGSGGHPNKSERVARNALCPCETSCSQLSSSPSQFQIAQVYARHAYIKLAGSTIGYSQIQEQLSNKRAERNRRVHLPPVKSNAGGPYHSVLSSEWIMASRCRRARPSGHFDEDE